jgi:hypothetical protein
MRSRVPQHVKPVEGLRQYRLDLKCLSVLRFKRESEVNFAAVDTRSQGLLGCVDVSTLPPPLPVPESAWQRHLSVVR